MREWLRKAKDGLKNVDVIGDFNPRSLFGNRSHNSYKKDKRIKKMTGKLKNIEGDNNDVGAKSHQNVMVCFVLYYIFLIDARCIHINPKQD